MNELTFILEQLGTRVPGGIGRYSEELFNALSRSIPEGWTLKGQLPPSISLENTRLTTEAQKLTYRRNNPLPTSIVSRLWSRGINIETPHTSIHAPSLLTPILKPRLGIKTVVTIHDTVPWSHPETLTPHGVKWHTKMAMSALKNADAIVTPTLAVKEELLEYFDFDDRLFVIPGASSLHLREQPTSAIDELKLPERFFLIVGTLEPRKQVLQAIQAAALSDTLPLIHIGPLGWGNIDVPKMLSDFGIPPHVFIDLGYVPEDLLVHIFRRATALIQPSSTEGFGLPLLEAMSLGTPAIISNVPALLEVSGNSSLVVEREHPDFVSKLADQMTSIAQNLELRDRLSALSLESSKRFSWVQSAQKVWDLHQKLTG